MSNKWIVIGGSVCFVVFLFSVWFVFTDPDTIHELKKKESPEDSLSLSNPNMVCTLKLLLPKAAPSLKSFLKALTTEGNRDLTFSGLAVVSKMANACQPLIDVGRDRVQVNKIALIAIKRDFAATCSLCELAVKAQRAGYSMVIFSSFLWLFERNCSIKTADKLLIPVVYSDHCQNSSDEVAEDNRKTEIMYSIFSAADQTDAHVRVSVVSNDLKTMEKYLEKLYVWFLLGPIFTLEWLRRKGKLRWATTATVDEESDNEEVVEESRGPYIQLGTRADNEGELRPLICVTSNTRTDYDLTISNNMRILIVRIAKVFRRIIRYLPVGLVYVLLILAALPVGISSGGLSFFRFDGEDNRTKNFWDVALPYQPRPLHEIKNFGNFQHVPGAAISYFVTVCWPVVQIFSFFMYSRFACKRTWTVSTNPSKFIRSDWFSSNMYLLVLCVIIPYSTYRSRKQIRDINNSGADWQFFYFTVCNVLCTVSNFLFIIILNKHKVVTRYVFYISVCMICAYVESDIVAVFYFILNSQGSLNNVKLTALRTVALGLTLTLSFSSSMHIIRKLMKPQESVFEELSEK